MSTQSNAGDITLWRRIFSYIGVALVMATVACSGSSDITAPPGAGLTAVATVGVNAPATNLLIGVSDSASLSTTTAVATPKDASGNALSGRTVTWSTSANNVATVNSSGVITAVGAGTATITATSDGKAGQISVTVSRPAVATVTMTPAAATLLVGVADSTTLGTAALTVTAKDANGNSLTGRTVAWTSGTASVATVSSNGMVKGVASGSSNITATIEGKTSTVPITVIRPPVTQVTVAPQSSTIKVGATETLAVTVLDAQAHLLTGRLIATVNNSASIVAVSGGQITGVAAGTGTVNFTSEGVTSVATIIVTP